MTNTQQTNLLLGAQAAYNYFQSRFPGCSFRVATKNAGRCGKGWFDSPDDLTILTAIATVSTNEGLETYQITSTNPEWTEFSKPVLLGEGPWVGAADYNPHEVDYPEEESLKNLKNYLSEKGYAQTAYTQVALIREAFEPFQLVYTYDLDLSRYGFDKTQYLTVPRTGAIGQKDEFAYCPLPS